MRNFQDIFETRKRSFISAFSICMTVPLKKWLMRPNGLMANVIGKNCFELSIYQNPK